IQKKSPPNKTAADTKIKTINRTSSWQDSYRVPSHYPLWDPTAHGKCPQTFTLKIVFYLLPSAP
ncbi:MAG: hypothetical protein NC930_08650, partial [Candidatus Omnitrophica bacterium]|nr:hypothetical protein [Candidatus Omnitrophota bacterium]